MSFASSMLDLVPRRSRRGGALLAGVGAAIVHALLVALAIAAGARAARRAIPAPAVTQLFEVELPRPAEPPEELPTPPPSPSPSVPPLAAPRVRAPRAAQPPPSAAPAEPPPAAQAGQVLSAADDVVDFRDAVVTGAADALAGGATAPTGTSKRAVPVAGTGQAGTTPGAARPLPAIDRSRPADLTSGSAWDCPFPPEADDALVDHAVVTLRVSVGAGGEVIDVRTTADPGQGFAREACACARNKKWAPALDRFGTAVASVAVVNVHFDP